METPSVERRGLAENTSSFRTHRSTGGHLRVVQAGESKAPSLDAEGLFRQYSRYVAAIAYRVMGRPEDADDVVQDVFLQAHQSLDSIREPAAIRGWLATTTVRIARRKLQRRRFLRMVGLDESPDYLDVASGVASPEQRVQVAAIYRTLDTVPPSWRAAWTLRRVEGMSLSETAKTCRCSLATVKRWVAAVDKKLRSEGGKGDR